MEWETAPRSRGRGRAFRRHHRRRLVAHARRWYLSIGYEARDADARARRNHDHLTVCSCYLCGNRRRWQGPTVQQRRRDQRDRYGGDDGWGAGPQARKCTGLVCVSIGVDKQGEACGPGDLLRLDDDAPEFGLAAGWYVLLGAAPGAGAAVDLLAAAGGGEDEEDGAGVCDAGRQRARVTAPPEALARMRRVLGGSGAGG